MKIFILFFSLFLPLIGIQAQTFRDISTKDVPKYKIKIRPISIDPKLGTVRTANEYLEDIELDTIVKVVAAVVSTNSDLGKPINYATQAALLTKADKSQVSNVDNTRDINKPISAATQAALNSLTALNSTSLTNIADAANAKFLLKADKTYTDAALILKADKSYTDAALILKADKTYTDAALILKADKTYTDNSLNLKFDKAGGAITGDVAMTGNINYFGGAKIAISPDGKTISIKPGGTAGAAIAKPPIELYKTPAPVQEDSVRGYLYKGKQLFKQTFNNSNVTATTVILSNIQDVYQLAGTITYTTANGNVITYDLQSMITTGLALLKYSITAGTLTINPYDYPTCTNQNFNVTAKYTKR
jgi:hypothetical protein